jgi:uncharacterized membrane protein
VPEGHYVLRVRATASEAAEVVELTAVISGQPELTLTTLDGRLSGKANAGRETPLDLVLRNTGTAPALGVRLEASPPAQWKVSFEPDQIERVEPGEEVQVKALVTPQEKALAGDYVVTLRAVPENARTERAEFRVTVTTSTLWGAVGLVIIAASLGVVALAVARFGRR